jgi:hypothetical protein
MLEPWQGLMYAKQLARASESQKQWPVRGAVGDWQTEYEGSHFYSPAINVDEVSPWDVLRKSSQAQFKTWLAYEATVKMKVTRFRVPRGHPTASGR